MQKLLEFNDTMQKLFLLIEVDCLISSSFISHCIVRMHARHLRMVVKAGVSPLILWFFFCSLFQSYPLLFVSLRLLCRPAYRRAILSSDVLCTCVWPKSLLSLYNTVQSSVPLLLLLLLLLHRISKKCPTYT